ncbi:MAG TPA: N(4)-(beta-N-acetylglucosaminyl)-L-asparaginase [Candidatus Sulfotelmatobacter sp.]|jgi:N4-(beta-N-acetylglucosaminyl)-L-asparaginase|nr:N(4)-(beta-N-acetylglucosaminyl)-L-asparaginase [Candidatus Sulfotelmatobacter sp.]
MELWTRRKFFVSSVVGGALAGAGRLFGRGLEIEETANAWAGAAAGGTRPVMISSANGVNALPKGMEVLKAGGDTLEAAVAAVTIVEDDPNDDSVGYGGLPNEEGVVELDASVMHGPTRRAGSVASVQKIKNVARLAKTVMERTNHTMIVGDGARRFGVAEGFEEMNLLTEHSRKIWLAWKAKTSFNWRPGIDSPEWKDYMAQLFDGDAEKIAYAEKRIADPITGTINCLAVNAKGEVSGTTTTSGLSWKIPGRVGDSPIIGAGLFVDGEVGGAGSTGKGEENIKISGGHTIVEMMRKGMKPGDACLEALGRVARNYNGDKKKLATFHLYYYAVNKDGEYGSASLWKNGYEAGKVAKFAVCDGTGSRLETCRPYFDAAGGDQ